MKSSELERKGRIRKELLSDGKNFGSHFFSHSIFKSNETSFDLFVEKYKRVCDYHLHKTLKSIYFRKILGTILRILSKI